MLNWVKTYWPILVGLSTSVLVAGQAIYTLGATRADFEAKAATADHAREDISQDLDQHTRRDGQEATAIRLERIEVQQTGLSRDVARVSEQLDTLSEDVREVMRRER